MEKRKLKTKALSIRVDDVINDFIEEFSKKTELSKTETTIFLLKRSIGILKFENEVNDNSILNAVLKEISNDENLTSLDIKIITCIYRMLDLDIIPTSFSGRISKELSLNLINKMINENLNAEEIVEHIKKINHLIPNFSPYFLSEIRQEITHNFLKKEKTKDTTINIGITENVTKFINKDK